MIKTYINGGGGGGVGGSTRRDNGYVGSEEGSFHTREAHGRPDLLRQNARTAMLQSVPRQDHRILVSLLTNGVIHLRVKMLDHLAVGIQVLLGGAVVLGKLGLRLT